MAESQKQNRNTLTLVLLLLVTSIGANFYQWKNHSTEVVVHGTEVDSLINARVEVERELTSVGMELDKYRGIAGNLDTLLNDVNGKIALQESKIRALLASEKNSSKLSKSLKAEMEVLRKLRDEALEQIDVLMAENKKLKEENSNLSSEVSSLSDQKNLLEGKVATASQLKVEYVKMTSFKKKSSGKYTESVLAKRTNKIESCFTLMDNKVAGTGDKMIYLVINAPNGKVLMGFTKAQFVDANGQTIDATASQKVAYTGEKQDLCLSFENDERILEPGTYTINVYAENVLVHQSTYVLK
jgi:FtsZ-binding cell division protein ZapB